MLHYGLDHGQHAGHQQQQGGDGGQEGGGGQCEGRGQGGCQGCHTEHIAFTHIQFMLIWNIWVPVKISFNSSFSKGVSSVMGVSFLPTYFE